MALNDPRHRNERFDSSSVGSYLVDYADRLRLALLTVDAGELERAHALIVAASTGGNRIFAIGNGGSAAIADHLSCDLTKGTHASGHPIVDTHSMVSNVALYSAIANDFGFEKVFTTQVDFLGRPGDVLIAISSSGNSPNIVDAVAHAQAKGMHTIGVSGFAGGKLRAGPAERKGEHVVLHVDANNYGIVEDAHQALMHILAQFIACHRDG